MSKLQVGEETFLVDDEVKDYVEWLRAEKASLKNTCRELVKRGGEKPVPSTWWEAMEIIIEENVQLRVEKTSLESAYRSLVKQDNYKAKLIKQLKGEKPIPFAWWKDCPALAQKTKERVIEENNQLRAKLKEKDEEKENETD